MILLPLQLACSLYMAWRYSKTEADPDWAMFNLWAFGLGRYGRDWLDCKTPMIHMTYWLIARVVGRDVARVKFAYHVLTALPGMVYTLLTGDGFGGLAFVMIINSGHMLAFHGNVSAIPAGLFLLAMASGNVWAACTFGVLAVLYDPKLAFSFLVMGVIKLWYIPAIVWGIIGLLSAMWIYSDRPKVWEWLWMSIIVIPKRMNEVRRKGKLYKWTPWWTREVLVYVLPWVMAAVWAKPDALYWLPAIAYVVLIGFGYVIRPNHLLPLAAWIAASGIDPKWALALVCFDLIAAGFYLGDNWERFYRLFGYAVQYGKHIGEWLKDKPGTLWVNSMHTQVYIYANKAVPYGLCEQIEIRETAHERRDEMIERWKRGQADWVVDEDSRGVNFKGTGYSLRVNSQNGFTIWEKR